MTLRMIDTFSGIGGFSLAARWLGGIETVQFVEREPYCQRILAKHFPNVPIHDDICTFDPEPGSADIVCGGFPCQDISTAGKQAGIKEGTRSGLFYELIRVVRVVRPRYVVLENVAAIVSNGLNTVLGELAEAGYDCEWACIRASDVGACHRRDRWWCAAYPSSAGLARGFTSGLAQMGAQGVSRLEPQPQRHSAGVAYADDRAWAIRREQLPGGEAPGKHGKRSENGDQRPGGLQGTSTKTNAPHPNHQGLEGRQPAGVPERGIQWPAWPGDPPGGRLNPNWRSYVSEPCLRRGDDGLSGRVDRLKALGNAVVPQVAMIPLARVLDLAG
jgi:DNA (cytosine-5)-methyltransferase 1